MLAIKVVTFIFSFLDKKLVKLLIKELYKLLADEKKSKDRFKEKHPNYRKFEVDPKPAVPFQAKEQPELDFTELKKEFMKKHGKALMPVRHRKNSLKPPLHVKCPHCDAPAEYIYVNNGKKASQMRCKVCSNIFSPDTPLTRKTVFLCPYCNKALYKWKEYEHLTIYKCDNDNCHRYLSELSKLKKRELKKLQTHSSQFKLRYQYRDYHFRPEELKHSAPNKPPANLKRIRNSQNVLGLILTFCVSFALPARKTALLLYMVFKIKVSHQTVLNYMQAAAYYCHNFNMKYKGAVDDIQAGDETYIKVKGKHNYVFFFISGKKKHITSYHIADNRGVCPATAAMLEARRTAHPEQQITYITDGNPSYPAGINFINTHSEDKKLKHHKVIGLKNLDIESETYREFKQIIERLNRTYKYHVKPTAGFNSTSGAVALTTLFVTHYNFLRPHQSLDYNVPIPLQQLEIIDTIQARWNKILAMSYG